MLQGISGDYLLQGIIFSPVENSEKEKKKLVFSDVFLFSKKLPIVVVCDVCLSVRPSLRLSVRLSVYPSVCRHWK